MFYYFYFHMVFDSSNAEFQLINLNQEITYLLIQILLNDWLNDFFS